MLASLLPGLRELRTPLAVGYLWLAFIYLHVASAGSIPPRSDASGVWLAIYQLLGFGGKGVALAVATFVAYVLGSLLPITYFAPTHAIAPLVRRRTTRSLGLTLAQMVKAYPSAVSRRDLRAYVNQRLVDMARANGGLWADDFAEALDDDNLRLGALTEPEQSLHLALRHSILNESHLLRVNLQVESENLYQSYDRECAEADFRLKIALPLGAVIASIGGLEGVLALKVLGVLIVVALTAQGFIRSREAEAELIQLLTQDVIRAPVLGRLEKAAQRRNDRLMRESHEDGEDGRCRAPEEQVVMYPDGHWLARPPSTETAGASSP